LKPLIKKMGDKKFEQKIKSYKKFLEAFNSRFSSKFFLPDELKNPENYISTKKYKFRCKRCGYENEIEARRFIENNCCSETPYL